MKIVSFAAFGVPSEVAACIEAPDVGAPDDDEIIVEVEAALAHAARSGRDGKILVTPNRKPG